MKWRLLERDDHTGLETWHAYDQSSDTTHIRTNPIAGVVDEIIEGNKKLYNDGTGGYISKAREWKHVARIPTWVQHKWLVEEGIDVFDKNATKQVVRKLNDSEWRFLRTSPGNV